MRASTQYVVRRLGDNQALFAYRSKKQYEEQHKPIPGTYVSIERVNTRRHYPQAPKVSLDHDHIVETFAMAQAAGSRDV